MGSLLKLSQNMSISLLQWQPVLNIKCGWLIVYSLPFHQCCTSHVRSYYGHGTGCLLPLLLMPIWNLYTLFVSFLNKHGWNMAFSSSGIIHKTTINENSYVYSFCKNAILEQINVWHVQVEGSVHVSYHNWSENKFPWRACTSLAHYYSK